MYHTYWFAYVESFIGSEEKWFAYVEPSLYPGDKTHLVMMNDLFNVLLNSVCYYFVENFCVNQVYWPVILFSCLTLYEGNAGLIKRFGGIAST